MSGRPDWSTVAAFIEDARSACCWPERPASVAGYDQLTATVRDAFDEAGVSVTDEHVQFVAILTLSIVAKASRQWFDNGALPQRSVLDIWSLSCLFACGLADHLDTGVLG